LVPGQLAYTPGCTILSVGFGVGVPFLIFGLAIRLGYTKRYFLVRGPNFFFGPANYHFVILLGALCIVFGLTGLPGHAQTRQDWALYLFGPSFILAFIVGLWHPWWLKPKWIRQLKENHPDIYPFLRDAAQEEVGNDLKKARAWSAKMDTVESQNEWVAEVRERLGMPDPRTTERADQGRQH
jgi:hypothetical protein